MLDPLLLLLIALALLVVLAFVIWPDKGLWARWQRARLNNERVRTEDALKHIHNCEMEQRRPTIESISGILQLTTNDSASLIENMQESELVTIDQGQIMLTPEGRDYALHIIRAHRLWERYLAEETGFDQELWHERAEFYEHIMTPVDVDDLSSRLGHPTHDPHGDPIPTAEGEYVTHGGEPLTTFPVDKAALIVHIEDEPEMVYAQLVAEDIHPGMEIRIVESSPERVRFWTNGQEHILAPMLASNVSVVPVPVPETYEAVDSYLLADLEPGQSAEVIGLSQACRGSERRRFLDLGILRGTEITAEMISPGGDPVAYRIRGAMIALRREQASMVKIKPIEAAVPHQA